MNCKFAFELRDIRGIFAHIYKINQLSYHTMVDYSAYTGVVFQCSELFILRCTVRLRARTNNERHESLSAKVSFRVAVTPVNRLSKKEGEITIGFVRMSGRVILAWNSLFYDTFSFLTMKSALGLVGLAISLSLGVCVTHSPLCSILNEMAVAPRLAVT